MTWHTMFWLGIAGLFLVWAVFLAACFLPEPEEVVPELDADETVVTVVSPWQFATDGHTGDWLFFDGEDASGHTVRVHFTTPGVQGIVTDWVADALVAKTDAFLREHG